MTDSDTLFASIKYFVTGTLDEKVQKLLENGGATRRKFLVDFITHVICGKDFDVTQIEEAQDLFEIPAVDEKWVLVSAKLGRLASTQAYDPLPNKLFSNLTFALTGGLTPNDNKALYAMIRFHGGQLHRNYTEKTSILICTSATGAAYAKALAVGTKIVTPDWVVDSVQEKRQMDTQIYHPRLLIVSSMVIERKIIQVGLIGDNGSDKTGVAVAGQSTISTAGDSEKKPGQGTVQITQKQGIGAMIRPVKSTNNPTVTTSTSITSVTVPAPKNIVIQQQPTQPPPPSSTSQLNIRPVVSTTVTQRQIEGTPVKIDVTPTEIKLVTADSSTINLPQSQSTTTTPVVSTVTPSSTTASTNPTLPLNTTSISTGTIGTGTVINVQQIPATTQLKITQQTVTSSGVVTGTIDAPASTPSTTTLIPKPQIVNTKQIQFIQQPNQQQSNNSVTKQTMIVQSNAAGQIGGQLQQQQQTVPVVSGVGSGPQQQSTITQIVNSSGTVQHQIIKTFPNQMMSNTTVATSAPPPAQQSQQPATPVGTVVAQQQQQQQQLQVLQQQPIQHASAPVPQQSQSQPQQQVQQQQQQQQGSQFQKHIILSQQQLAQLQQPSGGQVPTQGTATTTTTATGQNILIIQQNNNNSSNNNQPPMGDHQQQPQQIQQQQQQIQQINQQSTVQNPQNPQQQQQMIHSSPGGPQQQQQQLIHSSPGGSQQPQQMVNMQQNQSGSQSAGAGPVQAPQFSNVQFIRSNSQQPIGSVNINSGGGPGGGGGVGIVAGSNTGGHMQGQGQGQIQLQQINYQQQQQQQSQGQQQIQGMQQPQQQMIIAQQQGQSGQQQQQPQQQQMIISQQQGQPGQQQQQPQQWSNTGVQQMPQGMVGQQFIRTAGPQQQQQGGVPQRQLIQLDPQAQAQWQMMDPAKKAEYIAKLQSRRNLMLRQPLQFQNRPGGPAGPTSVVTTRMAANGQQHIVFRGQWIPQQQQQQQRQQIMLRSNGPGGLNPMQVQQQQQQQMGRTVVTTHVQGQVVAGGTTVVTGPVPPGAMINPGGGTGQIMGPGGQQQTVQVQLDPNGGAVQPRPQFQRMTSLPGQKIIQQQQQQQPPGQQQQQQIGGGGPTTIQTRYVTIDGNPLNPEQVQQMVQAGGGAGVVADGVNQPQIVSKTKTALANMLNSRMTGNSGGMPGAPMADVLEPSAAGTLRLMTAHHNATLNQGMVGQRAPQELLAQQQHQQQQRRTLGNITNGAGMVGGGGGGVGVIGGGGVVSGGPQQMVVGGPVQTSVGPPGGIHLTMGQQGPGGLKGTPYSPGRAPQPRPQFYGHNPNLPKLPPELFLLGCNFFVVEYDETQPEELFVWKELIRKHGGEIESYYCPRVTHVLCRSQRHGVVMQAIRDNGKRCVTAFWLNDVMVKKQLLPPWQALHLPTPSTFGRQRPATRHIVAISGFEGEERQRIKKMVEETGAKLTSYFSRQNTVLVCKKLDGAKYKRAKETGVPVVNATWLSDILMGNLSTMSNFDTAKYQQYNLSCPFRIEYGLVPHLMTSWKSPINLNQESHERLKRCHAEPVPGPKAKKPTLEVAPQPPKEEVPEVVTVKTQSNLGPTGFRVIFSQVENIEGLSRVVTAFGGTVVKEPAEATHLVMSKLVRTCKLLQCLCTVNAALSSEWLTESATAGELLPEEKFQLRDAEFEEMFKCDLQMVTKSPDRRKLLEGRTFHLTPSVRPTVKEMTKLIELCGGKVEKSRRSLLKIDEANAQKAFSYMVLSCPGDLHLLADILRAKQQRIICTTELVMKSIMNQAFVEDVEPHLIRCV